MRLTEYKKKRSFKKTPEPKWGKGTGTGATVSMPLHWDEVKKGLQVSRANEMGDLFKPVIGKGIDLAAVIKRNR